MPHAKRRVAVCRRATGSVCVLATAPVPGTSPNGTPVPWSSSRIVASELSTTGGVVHVALPPLDGSSRTPLAQAITALGPFESIQEFPCLFGMVTLDHTYLLVATAVEPCVHLPFDRSVWSVKSTQWVEVTLSGIPRPRVTKKDKARLEHFLSMSFTEGYYYSDEANLCSLFPFSNRRTSEYDPFEADWSVEMRRPFASVGCGDCCSTLLRGFAQGLKLQASLPQPGGGDQAGDLYVHMLGRQNRLNPGPRYFGRGLNERNAAGNDHIYELVFWFYSDAPANKAIRYARHVYLRGTVPLKFKSKLSTSGIGEASIIIGKDVFDGTAEYFDYTAAALHDLQSTTQVVFDPVGAVDRSGGATEATSVPSLRCVNLLRAVSSAGEDVLTDSFRTALQRYAERQASDAKCALNLDFATVDWLGLQKAHGTPGATAVLWQASLPFMDAGRTYTSGPYRCMPDPVDVNEHLNDQVQDRFLRVNCADSLDRTNVCVFFCIVQLSMKMLYGLNIPPKSVQRPAADGGPQSPRAAAAPAQTVDDEDPAKLEPLAVETELPPCYFQTFDDMRAETPPGLMAALVQLFVANGDCVAELYTSTGALHTAVMRRLVAGMKEAPSNSIISAQRRFENMFKDKKKRRVLETLLGLRREMHFPSLSGAFGLCMLSHDMWASAIVIQGIPSTLQITEGRIRAALQRHWVDIQQREGVEFATAKLSDDFAVHMGYDPDAAAADATAHTAGGDGDDELGDGTEVGTVETVAAPLMAVALLPSPNVAREILLRGALPIQLADGSEGYAALRPYEYSVEAEDKNMSPARQVASIASSLKAGFKRLVKR